MARDPKERCSTSRRCALGAAPFVIGAVALYNWVVSPHIGYLRAMQRLEPVMDRMAEELGTASEGLSDKLATLRTLRSRLDKTREGLFAVDESTAFLRDLQALVETTGCVMIAADFTRDEESPEDDDPNAPVLLEASHADLTVTGSYNQIVSLLRTLRERTQRVWVDSCDLNLVDPRNGRLECRFGLTIYAVLQSGGLPQ